MNAPETVAVSEVFTSIQGESTWAGFPCFFVRLAGCNLHCAYCDTPQAWGAGVETPIPILVEQFKASRAAIAEITGGEPLLQDGFAALAAGLRDSGRRLVLVETNGSLPLSLVPAGVICIVDVKTPGSGECGSFDPANIVRLRPQDEVKFVLTDRADYEWARAWIAQNDLSRRCGAVLLSPAAGQLAATDLAKWMIEDGLPARLQIQLHRLLGVG